MENKDIRRVNLASLLDRYLAKSDSTRASFAELCGITPAQLSQVLGEKSFRNIGDRMARKIEQALRLRSGWMDTIHIPVAREDEAISASSAHVPVAGEAISGHDGMIDIISLCQGWLYICTKSSDTYGLKIKGDGLWPRFQSGELIIIEPGTPVAPGDEVLITTRDGCSMIKVMHKTRDGDYQFSDVNCVSRPVTLNPDRIEKIHFIAAIIKHTRYVEPQTLSLID